MIFTSRRNEQPDDGYAETADRMFALAHEQPGFLGFDTARTDGLGITVCYWETEESIAAAFRLAVSRRPTDREAGILLGTYKRLHAQFAADPKAAEKLLSAGESPRDARLDVTEHAATTGVCTLILNLDEMLTRQ